MTQRLECEYLKTQRCLVCLDTHLAVAEQCERKKHQLATELNISAEMIKLNYGAHDRFRDKMKLQISSHEGLLHLGFLDPKELRVKTDLTHCPLHHPFLEQLIPIIKNLLDQAKVSAYDVHQRVGEAKGVIAFYSPTTGQSYLRLVLRSRESIDRIKKHLHLLEHVDVITVNLQPTPHALIEGEEEIFLKGEAITHRFGDIPLLLSPKGFVQTNTMMAQKLYSSAGQWAQEIGAKKAIDLYCGHGPFSFFLNAQGIHTLGIEINAHAVELANQAAKTFLSHGRRPEFYCAQADQMPELISSHRPDLIVLNPPRAGLKKGVDLLLAQEANYLMYSSCSSETLAQDYEILKRKYSIERVEIFDMFPHSQHFESLVLLKKTEAPPL